MDAALGHEDGGTDTAALKIEPMKLDPLHAAANLLKAIESKDVHAIDDALRMHWTACEQEGDGGDDEGGDEGEED